MDYYEAAEERKWKDAEWRIQDQYAEIQESVEEIMDDQEQFWSLAGNFLIDDEQFIATLRSMVNAIHQGRDGSTYAKSLAIRVFALAEYAIEDGAVL
jgi:hypothetical protein